MEEFTPENSLDLYYIAFILVLRNHVVFSVSLGWQIALNTHCYGEEVSPSESKPQKIQNTLSLQLKTTHGAKETDPEKVQKSFNLQIVLSVF